MSCDGCGQNRRIVCEYPNMGGIRVCLQCHLQIQRNEQQRRLIYAHEMNQLYGQMEYMADLPRGTMPREPVPQPIIQDRRTMNTNHITVTGGTVGAINTGSIERLNVAIDQATTANDDLANAIRQLGQAIIDHGELTDDQKNEATEQLAFLAQQANAPAEQRQPSVIRPTLDALSRLLSVADDLAQLWARFGEPIRQGTQHLDWQSAFN